VQHIGARVGTAREIFLSGTRALFKDLSPFEDTVFILGLKMR
jgi:hypothetical protein